MTASPQGRPWWRGAVLYQLYVRSWRDANDDGYGDLRGIVERLDHPGSEDKALAVQPLGRLGLPAEVAEVACFLASSAASYVTGADWAIDGGLGTRFA